VLRGYQPTTSEQWAFNPDGRPVANTTADLRMKAHPLVVTIVTACTPSTVPPNHPRSAIAAADPAGDVRRALGPVQAGATSGRRRSSSSTGLAVIGEPAEQGGGRGEAGALGRQPPVVEPRTGDADADHTGEVVVAGARESHLAGPGGRGGDRGSGIESGHRMSAASHGSNAIERRNELGAQKNTSYLGTSRPPYPTFDVPFDAGNFPLGAGPWHLQSTNEKIRTLPL